MEYSFFLTPIVFSDPTKENELINSSVKPEKSIPDHLLKFSKYLYIDPLNQRSQIFQDLQNKSGIYLWLNKLNNKYYIGSGVNLSVRLADYFQNWYLKQRTKLYIVRAINKYSLHNFALIILEITDKENILKSEQYWIDKLEPEYNLLSTAGNSSNYKHSAESIEKMRIKKIGSKHTLEVRKKMSEDRKGINAYWYGKNLSEETKNKLRIIALNRESSNKPGFDVEVLDTQTGIKTSYSSLRKACEAIGTYLSTISRIRERETAKGIHNSVYYLKKKRYILTINSAPQGSETKD